MGRQNGVFGDVIFRVGSGREDSVIADRDLLIDGESDEIAETPEARERTIAESAQFAFQRMARGDKERSRSDVDLIPDADAAIAADALAETDILSEPNAAEEIEEKRRSAFEAFVAERKEKIKDFFAPFLRAAGAGVFIG